MVLELQFFSVICLCPDEFFEPIRKLCDLTYSFPAILGIVQFFGSIVWKKKFLGDNTIPQAKIFSMNQIETDVALIFKWWGFGLGYGYRKFNNVMDETAIPRVKTSKFDNPNLKNGDLEKSTIYGWILIGNENKQHLKVKMHWLSSFSIRFQTNFRRFHPFVEAGTFAVKAMNADRIFFETNFIKAGILLAPLTLSTGGVLTISPYLAFRSAVNFIYDYEQYSFSSINAGVEIHYIF